MTYIQDLPALEATNTYALPLHSRQKKSALQRLNISSATLKFRFLTTRVLLLADTKFLLGNNCTITVDVGASQIIQ